MTARPDVSDGELCAFLDERLPETRRLEIESWLAGCPDGAARLAGWRRQSRMIRAAYDRVAQEPLPYFLTAPLPERRIAPFPHAVAPSWEPPLSPAARGTANRASRRFSLRSFALVLAAVAALLGLVASGLLQGLHRPAAQPLVAISPAPDQSLLRRAGETWTSFAFLPGLRLDAIGETSAQLAQSAGLSLPLPLTPPGLRLIGLRLLPGERERAGLLLYDLAGARIMLYAARTDAPAAPSIVLRDMNEATSALYVKGGVAYVLTGQAGRAVLLDLASAMRESLP